jgi:hypothetical protein
MGEAGPPVLAGRTYAAPARGNDGGRGPADADRCAPQGAAPAHGGNDGDEEEKNTDELDADIAKVLGTSRNAVIGRSRRLRGIVYQSDIDSWTRANARRSAEAHKRSLIRRDLQGKIVTEMLKSIASGVPREKAMERAFKAGAYWWQIGEHFGMSQQTAYETVKRAKKKRARK